MRLSTAYYPEYINYTCTDCWTDNVEAEVDSIEGDDVYVYCPVCDSPTYVRVIED